MTEEQSLLEKLAEEITQIPRGTPSLMKINARKKLTDISQEQILTSLNPEHFQRESERMYVNNAIKGLVIHLIYDPLWKMDRLNISLNTLPYTDVWRTLSDDKITEFAKAVDRQYQRSHKK